ncbi:ROK family protein [Actinomyces sp. F1_1611]
MTEHFLGIDVGGTTIKTISVSDDGEVLGTYREATSDRVEDQIKKIGLKQCQLDPEIVGIGLLAPGLVDTSRGQLVYSANLGLRNLDWKAHLEESTGVPVRLDHDGRAAGLAEGILGAARGADSFVVIPIGTGISASITLEGKAWPGHTFGSGELGHTPIFPGGDPCSCGQNGCLEVYASAEGIRRQYRRRSGREATADQIEELLDTDPIAREVWDQATYALALACTHLTLIVDPQRIIFAGGLSRAGDRLLVPVQEQLTGLLKWRRPPEVALSTLDARAGQWGAAILGAQAAGSTCYQNWQLNS